jgi:solute carrier family 15 oligopeptide transporter 1
MLIGMGAGGIKPCVAAFGGDQFVLPEQSRQLAAFFSIFYFIVCSAGVLAALVTPEIRLLHCLGEDSCYPLAFALPAVLMLLVCGASARLSAAGPDHHS